MASWQMFTCGCKRMTYLIEKIAFSLNIVIFLHLIVLDNNQTIPIIQIALSVAEELHCREQELILVRIDAVCILYL